MLKLEFHPKKFKNLISTSCNSTAPWLWRWVS